MRLLGIVTILLCYAVLIPAAINAIIEEIHDYRMRRVRTNVRFFPLIESSRSIWRGVK